MTEEENPTQDQAEPEAPQAESSSATAADAGREASADSPTHPSASETPDQSVPETVEEGGPREPAGEMSRSWQPVAVILLILGLVGFSAASLTALLISSRPASGQEKAVAEIQESIGRLEKTLAQVNLQQQAEPKVIAVSAERAAEGFREQMALADNARSEGALDRAIEHYRAALEADTTRRLSDEAHYELSRCLLKMEREEEALDHLRAIVSRYRGSRHYVASAVLLAERLIARDELLPARKLLYQILAARNAWGPDEQERIARVVYMVARCYEREAEIIESSKGLLPSGERLRAGQ